MAIEIGPAPSVPLDSIIELDFNNKSAISVYPLWHARYNGVTPATFSLTSNSGLYSRSFLTNSMSPVPTAIWIGCTPVGFSCRFISAFFSSKYSTVFMRFICVAIINGVPPELVFASISAPSSINILTASRLPN